MSAIFSPRWYRVADLKPRLSPLVRLRRQRVRHETWYLLMDRSSSRSVRLNAAAYAIAGRFDGNHSVQHLWNQRFNLGNDPPTQDEIIQLLAQLREAALIQFDTPADVELLVPHLERTESQRWRSSLLAWRFRLADPSALLERLAPLERVLFSRTALIVWILAMLLLLALALQHAPTLVEHGQKWLTTPRYAVLAAVLYVPFKLLHELAHGLAVRHWGGEVRSAGITLMLGLPVPWVDASAATGFTQRHKRIFVSAVGIMTELALAAIALPLWLWLQDGLLRDAAFVTVIMAGVSTLLFNANPLQRLDGYYIATDALSLPNLAFRSRTWWIDLLGRRLLHLPICDPMATARGERPWLMAYAPLAWLYSLVIATIATLWLGEFSLALGLVGGTLLAWKMGLSPVLSLLSTLNRAALTQRSITRRWQWIRLLAGVLLAALLLLPVPQRTRMQGVVWPPDQAQLRVEEDGFVSQIQVANDKPVSADETIIVLSNPELQTQFERQTNRVAALEAELVHSWPGAGQTSNGRSGDAQAELTSAQAQLDRLRERVAGLNVRARIDGRVALTGKSDLQGRYLRRGDLVGQILNGAAPTIRVALPESEATSLRLDKSATAINDVTVRLTSSPEHMFTARLVRDGGGAVQQLPSAALSQRHGGPLATDPLDTNDLKPLLPVIVLDIQLDPATTAPPPRLGERAWVCFNAGFSPIAWQLSDRLRYEILRRFNPRF